MARPRRPGRERRPEAELRMADRLVLELGPSRMGDQGIDAGEVARLEAVWAAFGPRLMAETAADEGWPWALGAFGEPERPKPRPGRGGSLPVR